MTNTNFTLEHYWSAETREHQSVAEKTFETLLPEFEKTLELCAASIRAGGKLLFFGNGGSAADAQHLATELAVRYIKDRAPIAAIALTTDTSNLTAAGNDYGFEYIFSRQVEALGTPGDIAIAFSTSGNSANILTALQKAKDMNLKTIGFTGETGGKMPPLCDALIRIPSQTTARIQEMHITIGHLLCGSLERELGLL